MYRVESPKNGCYDYGQLLVVQGYGDTIAQVAFAYSESRCSLRCARGLYGTNPAIWTPWTEIAMRTAPEVHDLPLADHWEPYGDGLCWYTRNQFGEVSIGMLVRSTATVSVDGTQFATMPEGFRPRVTVVAPANATANDYSHSVCHVTINPDGGVYLHFDTSSLSGKTVVQLVCPVFHYPAK